MIRYDLIKGLAIALAVVGVVALGATVVLSSPDVPPVTIATWSHDDPVDFVATATGELAGTTTSAGYGQPYNSTADAAQSWGPISPQAWFGVRIPIDSAKTFVTEPLQREAIENKDLAASCQGVRLKNQLRRLRNRHEEARHVGMRDGDGAAPLDLLSKLLDDRA